MLEVSQYLPLKLYVWKRAEMVTFPMARSTFLLRLWTKLGIWVDRLIISVLVLNWLLNSVNFVFLFTCIYSGSEQVGSADDFWGVLWGSVLKELRRWFWEAVHLHCSVLCRFSLNLLVKTTIISLLGRHGLILPRRNKWVMLIQLGQVLRLASL